MREFCYYCNKEKDHINWRSKLIDISKTEKKLIWMCGDHYAPIKPEFVPERTREDRRRAFKDIIQPYRENTLSKEYVDTYGTRHLNVSEGEVARAKYTWRDQPGWSDHFVK